MALGWIRLGLAILVVAATIAGAVEQACAERRLALVVGNGSYAHAATLANPVNDANDIAAALKDVGFEVILGLDLDKRAFELKVRDFARTLAQADVGLVFYAGHGLQVGRVNYLVPVDARLESDRDLEFETIRLELILSQMEIAREGKTNIVFLDACRDNPFSRSLARAMGTRSAMLGRGLAQVQGGVGTFVSYATEPDKVALDGQGRNSPFTTALKKHIGAEGRSLSATMIEVRKEVIAVTRGQQVPWDHSSMTGEFYFKSPKDGARASGAEVAALAARAKAMEAELRSRADAETIARLAVLKERRRDVERRVREARDQLFERQRTLATERDSQKVRHIQQDIFASQRRLGDAQAELRRTDEEIAQLEAKSKEPPVVPKSGVQQASVDAPGKTAVRRFAGFEPASRSDGVEVYPGAKPRGRLIEAGSADTVAACQAVCRANSGCVAFASERGSGVCELYGSAEGLRKDAGWTAGLRD